MAGGRSGTPTHLERDGWWSRSPDLLVVMDSAGRIRDANPAWTDRLGWPLDRLIGQSFQELSDEADGDAVGARPAFDRRLRHADGSLVWFSWTMARDGPLVYGSGRDIAVERHAQAVLQTTREQLRQSQKLEAVGHLTGGLVHDFNNMLGAIATNLELAQRRLVRHEIEEVARHVVSAQAATTRASVLAQRLLAFARPHAADARVVDLNDVVVGIADMIHRTMPSGVRIVIDYAPTRCPVAIDANQFENALLNLCNNARDAMAGGGRLTISTRHRTLDASEAATAAVAPGPYVAVAVTDTGVGMAPDTLLRVFEPFFTTKPIGSGTGLGLSMVQAFAREANGSATIASTPGQGTTVTLLLPSAAAAVVAKEVSEFESVS